MQNDVEKTPIPQHARTHTHTAAAQPTCFARAKKSDRRFGPGMSRIIHHGRFAPRFGGQGGDTLTGWPTEAGPKNLEQCIFGYSRLHLVRSLTRNIVFHIKQCWYYTCDQRYRTNSEHHRQTTTIISHHQHERSRLQELHTGCDVHNLARFQTMAFILSNDLVHASKDVGR